MLQHCIQFNHAFCHSCPFVEILSRDILIFIVIKKSSGRVCRCEFLDSFSSTV
jgi:hypothetical protein